MTPLTPVEYRQAELDDVPAIMESRSKDARWGPADRRTGAYLAGEHHPGHALAPRVGFVAVQGHFVVGYIAGHLTRRYDCDGELQYLWVSEECRGQGVATRLLRMLFDWFEQQQAKRICVDVVPHNKVARSFYHTHGAIELNPHWLVWEDIQK